jgi:hypothetical protein
MRIKIALRLAVVFSLSSVRSSRTRGRRPRGLSKRPTANLYGSAVVLPTAAILTYLAGPVLLGDGALVEELSDRFLVSIPSLATFLSLMYSLMFEFNQSSRVASMDLLNWLPVTPTEYVAGSALCTSYFISPMLALLLGASLGLSLLTGTMAAWALCAILAIIGVVLGISISEIARAFLSRASAGLDSRAGGLATATRLLIGVGMIAFLATMFNVNLFLRILGWFVGSVTDAWFVPMLWPSMTVIAGLQDNLAQAAGYLALSLSFALLLFRLAVLARGRYWAPAPATAKRGGLQSANAGRSPLRLLGFDSAEAALIRKDLWSLVRRREMTVWLAIPAMFFVMSLVNWATGLSEGAAGSLSELGSLMPMGLGVLFLSFYVSLVSFGQEGEAFTHLLVTPLQKHQIARAKLAASMIPASLVLPMVLVIVGLTARPGWAFMVAISILAVSTLLEASLVGLALGTRYPDFTEIPRARFIERKGAYIGMFVTASAAGITMLPALLAHLAPTVLGLAAATIIGLAIAVAIGLLGYRSVLSGIENLWARQMA